MSFVIHAPTPSTPEDEIVSGPFWPNIDPKMVREAYRIDNTTNPARLACRDCRHDRPPAHHGGGWHNGANAGLFVLNVNYAASTSSTNVGGRLAKV